MELEECGWSELDELLELLDDPRSSLPTPDPGELELEECGWSELLDDELEGPPQVDCVVEDEEDEQSSRFMFALVRVKEPDFRDVR